ncbi:chaplin family protein [Actinomycetospora chiangmaiensis]|uniref:chaplin family protein n=1 Tax=Actinomycetospora chiangmaiensis TaxID=402650 RepID=UPI000A078057
MSVRRTVAGIVVGSGLLGLPLLAAGTASATEGSGHGHAAAPSCTTTGTASNSPGVSSGNVTQVPVFNCSSVFGSPAVAVTGPFVG